MFSFLISDENAHFPFLQKHPEQLYKEEKIDKDVLFGVTNAVSKLTLQVKLN